MNEKEKITPLQNSEDFDKLVLNLKEELTLKDKEIETWKNAKIKTEEKLWEEEKRAKRLEQEKEDLRKENMRQRRIELDNKDTTNKNEFLEKFQELQANK